MRGLALEGGGSRGSYHMGVVKAYMENGYTFDGFSGTSIGSINAALLAQGDYERGLQLWSELSMDKLFDATDAELEFLSSLRLRHDLFSNLGARLKKIIDNGGIDTSKMRALVASAVDEDKIRATGHDLGLVTFSLSERRACELYLEDIPPGQLISYLMASASFPGFKPEVIEGNQFVDGGLVNNCPVNLLLNKGYDEILIVRTLAPGRYLKFKSDQAQITVITPPKTIGNVMKFDSGRIAENIQLGFHDGLRQLRDLRGRNYYICPENAAELGVRLLAIDTKVIGRIGKLLKLPEMPLSRLLFEHIIPHFGRQLGLPADYDWMDFVVGLLETAALTCEVPRYRVYDFDEFRDLLRAQEKKRPFISRPREAAAQQLMLRAILLM